jgi:hypothetical protein
LFDPFDDKPKLAWLETGMKLPLLQYLFFRKTCPCQPPLGMGEFAYNSETFHAFEAEEEMKKFTLAALKRLKAGRIIPFTTDVLTLPLGP